CNCRYLRRVRWGRPDPGLCHRNLRHLFLSDLEHTNVRCLIPEFDVEGVGVGIVAKHVQRYATQAKGTNVVFDAEQGTGRMAVTLVLWFNPQIVHICDAAPSPILNGDPARSDTDFLGEPTDGEEVVVRGCEALREKF